MASSSSGKPLLLLFFLLGVLGVVVWWWVVCCVYVYYMQTILGYASLEAFQPSRGINMDAIWPAPQSSWRHPPHRPQPQQPRHHHTSLRHPPLYPTLVYCACTNCSQISVFAQATPSCQSYPPLPQRKFQLFDR